MDRNCSEVCTCVDLWRSVDASLDLRLKQEGASFTEGEVPLLELPLY